jgi:hypothetical protein
MTTLPVIPLAKGRGLTLLAGNFGLRRRWLEPDWMLRRRCRWVIYGYAGYSLEPAFGIRLPWRRRLLRWWRWHVC